MEELSKFKGLFEVNEAVFLAMAGRLSAAPEFTNIDEEKKVAKISLATHYLLPEEWQRGDCGGNPSAPVSALE